MLILGRRLVLMFGLIFCTAAACGAAASLAAEESPERTWWEHCEELPSTEAQACFEEHNGERSPDRALVARSACYPTEFVYRPHAFGISCDRTMSIRGLRWKRYGKPVAVGKGIARTQGCEPSCANGEVRWLRVTVRLHRLVRCGGRPIYARLTYRLHGRIIHGFRRTATSRMIATNEYGEPTCA